MTKLHLVSLGAWCRPAHQIHTFSSGRERAMTALRGPFDWIITPFAALRACLTPGFVPGSVLRPGRCHVSPLGSAACTATGVIFHHQLGPTQMKALGHGTPGLPIPPSETFDALATDARDRFDHTYRYLTALKEHDGEILFVRWQRMGHPDRYLPLAFEDETDAAMTDLLHGFLGHRRFHLLTVVSRITQARTAPFETPIIALSRHGRAITCHLHERYGWNGDQTHNFRGDDHSWGTLLQTVTDPIAVRDGPLRQALARLLSGRYRSVTPK